MNHDLASNAAPVRPRVAIVILNWNGKDDTLECLESVRHVDYPNFEIIVVDNGSSDGSVAAIRERFPAMTVIETGANLGYAGGNNVGISHALRNEAEYVLVLNNDTTVDASFLDHLVRIGEVMPDAGILGPSIYQYYSPDMPWYSYTLFDPERVKFITKEVTANDPIARSVDGVIGCSMLIKAKVFRKIGALEPKYFLCYEEHDFCFRAARAGFKCLVVSPAKIWHKVGSTLGEMESPVRSYFNTRNRLLWAERNVSITSRLRLFKIVLSLLITELFPRFHIPTSSKSVSTAKALYWAVREFGRELVKQYHSPMYKARLWGTRDYLLRRFGNGPSFSSLDNR